VIENLSSGVVWNGKRPSMSPSIQSAKFPSQTRDRSKSIISRVVEDTYGLQEEEEQNGITSTGNDKKFLKKDLKSNNNNKPYD
jgi:hypothetical protein